MRLPPSGAITLLLAGCTAPPHPQAAPTEAEFRTLAMNDLFVLVEARGESSAVLVRSASRISKRDFGQNRRNTAGLWAGIGAESSLRA